MTQEIQKRDPNTGLFPNITYIYREDGLGIDWRKMLKPEHLAFNNTYAAQIKAQYQVDDLSKLDKTTVEDKYLVILLSGIKYLAKIRGYITVDNKITHSDYAKGTANCSITWIPNIETDMDVVQFSDSASASLQNTQGFGQFFLESIASNRAFVRAVRNFLEINIVGFDELGGSEDKKNEKTKNQDDNASEAMNSPKELLRMELKKQRLTTIGQLKAHEKVVLNADKFSVNPKDWTFTKIDEMDITDVFILLSLFKT